MNKNIWIISERSIDAYTAILNIRIKFIDSKVNVIYKDDIDEIDLNNIICDIFKIRNTHIYLLNIDLNKTIISYINNSANNITFISTNPMYDKHHIRYKWCKGYYKYKNKKMSLTSITSMILTPDYFVLRIMDIMHNIYINNQILSIPFDFRFYNLFEIYGDKYIDTLYERYCQYRMIFISPYDIYRMEGHIIDNVCYDVDKTIVKDFLSNNKYVSKNFIENPFDAQNAYLAICRDAGNLKFCVSDVQYQLYTDIVRLIMNHPNILKYVSYQTAELCLLKTYVSNSLDYISNEYLPLCNDAIGKIKEIRERIDTSNMEQVPLYEVGIGNTSYYKITTEEACAKSYYDKQADKYIVII